MAALGDARRRGLTRHIGVSNFTIATLAEAIRVSPEPIVTNQIEYHPYLDQDEAARGDPRPWPRRHGLLPDRARQCRRRCRSSAPSRGRTARPRLRSRCAGSSSRATSSPFRGPRRSNGLRENLDVFDFELTAAEMGTDGWPYTPGLEVHQPAGLGAGVGLERRSPAQRARLPCQSATLRQSSPPEARHAAMTKPARRKRANGACAARHGRRDRCRPWTMSRG